MKVSFVGHASILIETRGVSILSDPWWNGPCFGAQWWLHPAPFLEAIEPRSPDYIYLSHGHHDHFHPPTLKLFDRRTPILIARDSDLGPAVQGLGFPIIPVGGDEEYKLATDFHCRIIPTRSDDTLMTVTDGDETCVNANDALHACTTDVQGRFISELRKHHPRLDYVFCGYGVASHFPNCYVIPGKDRVASATRRQRHFNRAWARIIHGLEPRFGFPFAADVTFLDEDLLWSNEPVHNAERPTSVFRGLHPTAPTEVIDIAPGFVVENGRVVADRRRQPLSAAALAARYEDAMCRVNRHPPVTRDVYDRLLDLFRANVERCQPYLVTFAGDYRALICFKGGDMAMRVAKRGDALTVEDVPAAAAGPCDVVYTTRTTYLRTSLTTRYGHEVLFVGSGGIFEYPATTRLDENIHHELAVMMRPADECPAPRPTGMPARLRAVKRRIRSFIASPGDDLYDLRTWTVFAGRRTEVDAR